MLQLALLLAMACGAILFEGACPMPGLFGRSRKALLGLGNRIHPGNILWGCGHM